MHDRAMQTLYKIALEPMAETLADPNSYGFRPRRLIIPIQSEPLFRFKVNHLFRMKVNHKDG
jgi:hypothetical protein